MNVIRKGLIATLSLLAYHTLSGQHNFTLDECMRYAVEHNLELSNYALDESISRSDYTAAIGDILPEVKAGSNISKRFGRSVDPNTNLYTGNSFTEASLNLNLSVPIFEGFTKINKIAFQRLGVSVSRLNHERRQSEIAFEVMDAFYKVVFEEQLEQLAREQRRLSEYYLRQTETFAELGLKAETDIQEVKARLQADIYQEIFRSNSKQTSLLVLKQLLNLTGQDSLRIRYDTIAAIPEVLPAVQAVSVYETAQQTLPDFRLMELQQKAAQKSKAIAIGKLSPTLQGEFELYSGYSGTETDAATGGQKTFRTQLKDNVRKYIGLNLSIPIFSNLKGITGIRKEKWKMEQVSNNNEQHRQQLYTEIETTCMDLKTAVKEWLQARERVNAEEAVLKQSERKWEEGLISIFELMEIRNRYITAKAEITRTKLQYQIKQRTLGYFKGEGLYK